MNKLVVLLRCYFYCSFCNLFCIEEVQTLKAIVLSGGGTDSAVCLGLAVNKFGNENVLSLTFDYGQKHVIELEYVEKLCNYYNVESRKINLVPIFEKSGSALLRHNQEAEIVKSSYDQQSAKRNGSPLVTYVPFRSGVLASIATALALSQGYSAIVYGLNSWSSNRNSYPDSCSFFHASMSEAVHIGSGGCVDLLAPFVNETKAYVVSYGDKIGVPFKYTYSCYEGREKSCGLCGACRERLLAFEKSNLKDPIEYEIC